MKRYMIRRNPATGRWVIYVRAGVRLQWPDDIRHLPIETPIYEIMGSADTQARAIQALTA